MELLGLGDGAGHAVLPGGEHDPGAIGGGEPAPLDAHGLGHGEDHLVAAGGGDHREAHPGVAARGLDDGAPRDERARGFRGVDHGTGDAVLDRAAGVGGLVLAEDGRPSLGEGGEVDEGG
jgi:hypothetical protein